MGGEKTFFLKWPEVVSKNESWSQSREAAASCAVGVWDFPIGL